MSNDAGHPAIAEQESSRTWASVYVIAADNGEVKIGYAMAPATRFVTVRREYAAKRGFSDARLVGWIEASAADVLEVIAHRHFRPQWVSGEWFNVDPEAALDQIAALWDRVAVQFYGEPPCRLVRPTA